MKEYVFTSESVSEGHPDKVADRISDGVVDLYLGAAPEARVACETMVTTNRIILAGEVRGPESITADDIEEVARGAVREIGYEQEGFHWKNAVFENHLHEQSADIAQGVDAAGNKDEGAGDQGIMFGYACDETESFMPAPIDYSHRILKSLAAARHSGESPELEPDSKSQVTLKYVDGKPVGATSIVVSTQHKEGVTQEALRALVRKHVEGVLPEGWMCPEDEFYVNPTASSSSVVLMVTRALRAARSSWIPTAAQHRTVVVPSPARTRPRWTVRRLMLRVTSRKTWWPRAFPRTVPSSLPMPLVSPSRSRFMWTSGPMRRVLTRTACPAFCRIW